MHYLVMLDLGGEVDPDSESSVAERIAELLAPYYQSGQATPQKDYLGAEEEWYAVKSAVEAGLLDCRWERADEPVVDANQRRAAWKADWLAAWSKRQEQKSWMVATIRLYPHDATAAALNELRTNASASGGESEGGRYEEGYFADEAGIYQWKIYGSWDSWSVVDGRSRFPIKTQPDDLNGGSRRGVARKGDIDWARLREEHVASAQKRWDEWQRAPTEKRNYVAAMGDIDPTETRQKYVERQGSFITYAFVDDSGSWRERAPHLGIHSTANTTYAHGFAQWLGNVPDDHVLAQIDCHG